MSRKKLNRSFGCHTADRVREVASSIPDLLQAESLHMTEDLQASTWQAYVNNK